MSVTVEYSNIIEGKPNRKLIVPYEHGDYEIKALHIMCMVQARRYGKNYISKILENN